MNTRLLFPRLFVISISLFFTASVIAQSSEAEALPVNITNKADSRIRLENEPTVAPPVEARRPRTVSAPPASGPLITIPAISSTAKVNQLLLMAIQSHVGAPYHFNRTGPEEFDCSGLVWRAFQDIGVDFQRGPARSYWAMFVAPPENEEFKFGTLVFFSNLSHVGIVVDQKGFYHSARHGGVMYSPFNDYWLSRIDGFRRVPVAALQSTTASSQPRVTKPAVNQSLVEQNNEP